MKTVLFSKPSTIGLVCIAVLPNVFSGTLAKRESFWVHSQVDLPGHEKDTSLLVFGLIYIWMT